MKKSSATASLVSRPNQTATCPSQGKEEARATTAISTEVKDPDARAVSGESRSARAGPVIGDDRNTTGAVARLLLKRIPAYPG